MYKGEPSKGIAFFKLLEESDNFTSEMGKVTLASSKLEMMLIKHLKLKEIKGNFNKATLGTLIRKIEQNELLNVKLISSLNIILKQRNYLTHNLYALFIDKIEETILEKHNLLDSDVELYIEQAWQLRNNINDVVLIIKELNEKE